MFHMLIAFSVLQIVYYLFGSIKTIKGQIIEINMKADKF